MIAVRLSTPEDVSYLVPRLAQEDLRELIAAGSRSPEGSLMAGLASPDACLTGLNKDGELILMFGTLPHHVMPL